jgi:hypothetical protein
MRAVSSHGVHCVQQPQQTTTAQHRLGEKEASAMTAWNIDELSKIEKVDELEIAPRRQDGTLRDPVRIWVVRHGDDLYVRAYRGSGALWYRHLQARHEGRIRADGVDKDVTFVAETNPDTNSQIDTAYRSKYGRYGSQYIDPMVAPQARATTIKIVPH